MAIGAALIVRGGADRWLDGPPLPGLADSVTGFWGRPNALTMSRDGTRLAAADGSRLTYFDVPNDRELWTTHLRAFARRAAAPPSLMLSPDASKLLYVADEAFAVLDTARGDLVLTPTCVPSDAPAGMSFVRSGTFAGGGAVLVLSAASKREPGDGRLCILDAASGSVEVTVPRACTSLTATARGDRVWGICDRRPTALDPATGAELLKIDMVAHALAVFPDGTRIITTSSTYADPRRVQIHDAGSGALLLEFPIAEPTNALVGPLRGGEAWLVSGSKLLFEVDIATRRVTRTLCDELRAAATAADVVITASDACHPDGQSLWARSANP